MKRFLFITSIVVLGGFCGIAVAALTGGTTTFFGLLRVCDGGDGSCPTGGTATSDGDLLVEDAFECDGAADIGTTLAVGGDVTFNGGAGALTCGDGDCSLVLTDNDSTAFVAGSAGLLNLLTLDTGDNTETVIVTGTTTVTAFHVDIGDAQFDEDINVTLSGAFGTTLGVTGITTPIGGVANAGGTTLTVGRPGSVHTGGVPATATAEGNDATPVTTEIYYSELFVPFNMTVTGISVFNGSVASDDWHRALLDVDGALVTGSATGGVTSSGTQVYQKVPFTGGAITILGPATYYVAQICDGTTDRYNAHGSGTTELAFSQSMVAGKITGASYGAIPASNSLTLTFTTALGPIASLY